VKPLAGGFTGSPGWAGQQQPPDRVARVEAAACSSRAKSSVRIDRFVAGTTASVIRCRWRRRAANRA
jgi:hypothetical protein